MKKLFTLLLAVAASVGTMFAWDYERVQIGDLYYNLNATRQTAEVTSQNSSYPYWSTTITTAIIPASVNYNSVTYSVTSIGDVAFGECRGLTSVTIPSSVTSIGNYAFGECSGLTSVTIPSSVTSIGNYAFMSCSGLTSVTIPSSVTSIGDDAFSGCSINTINFAGSIEDWCNKTWSPVSVSGNYQLQFNGVLQENIIIPNSITGVGQWAFWGCTSLTSVTIPSSVTSIGNYAFVGCSGLTSVTIPNSVTSIGDDAFYYCTGLTKVNITDIAAWCNITFSSYSSNPLYYAKHLYVNDTEVTNLTIPNSVTSIGNSAFAGCSGLTSVTIPSSITSIGSRAFWDCTSLTSVTIGNSVTSIGDDAFYGCSGLTSVIWNAKNCADFASNNTPFYDLRSQITSFTFSNEVEHIPANLCNGMSNLTSVTIPNSVTSIGDGAFSGCSGLTSVTIPNSVTSIGNYAFSGCSGLTSVEAPAGFFDIPEGRWSSYTKILNHVTVNGGELTENALLFINRSYKTLQTLDVSGVTNTEFADEAFKGYYNLQQLVLPAGLQKVGYMMVAGCKNLQSIDIPASVEEIEQSAFEDCRSIQSITFGGAPAGAPGRFNAPATSASQLRRIGNWAFYNAHELQNLEIPEGVTEIGDGAFYGCTYLEEMVLPSSVQSIGDNCFALCAKLTKITCNAVTPPTIEAKTFFDVKRQIPVYVPDEAVASYEGDTYWQEFDIQGISHMPQGVENVQSNQVQNTKILQNGQIFILRGEKVYTVTGQEVR